MMIASLKRRPWLLYLALALPVCAWFKRGHFILHGDLGWPQFFSDFAYLCRHVWDASVNFGYPATRQLCHLYPFVIHGSLIEKALGHGPQVQLVIYLFSFAFSGIGAYFLSRALGLGKLGALFSGFFYMFSPYAMAGAWVPAYGMNLQFYCFLPIGGYLFIEYIKTDQSSRRAKLLLATFSTHLFAAFVNPSFFALYVFFVAVFAFWMYADDQAKGQDIALGTLTYGAALFFLNAFWLIPFLYSFDAEFQSASNQVAGLISDIETVKLNSVRVADAFRMTGLWTLRAGQWGDHYYDWHALLDRPGYILVSFLIPLLAISRFVLNKRPPGKTALLMLGVFLLGVVLNSGATAGGLLKPPADWIFSLPFLQRAFRAVYLKLGGVLALPLVYLAADALEKLCQRLKTSHAAALCGTIAGLFLFICGRPFLDGSIIKSEGRYLPAARVKIPREYYDLRDFDRQDPMDARYLALPIPPSYNLILKWDDGGFHGGDFLRYFLNKPLVYQNEGKPITAWLVDCLNDPRASCTRLLGLLNIKYVFQHHDIAPISKDYYLVKREFSDPRFRPALKNRYFTLYKNEDLIDFFPHLYVPDSVVPVWSVALDARLLLGDPSPAARREAFLSFDDLEQKNALTAMLRGLLRPDGKKGRGTLLEYRKINPTKYRVRARRARGTMPLVFSESFDPGWRAFVTRYAPTSGKGNAFISREVQGTIQNDNLPDGFIGETWLATPLPERNHFLANGYANGWLVDTAALCAGAKAPCVHHADGAVDFELLLEYRPQGLFYLGLLVTVAALASLILSCLAPWALKR